MVHRADMLKMFYDHAIKAGVEVRFGVLIASIQDSVYQPTVRLIDGTVLSADLLIGADGQ